MAVVNVVAVAFVVDDEVARKKEDLSRGKGMS